MDDNIDPRISIIDERLSGIEHVITIGSGKGGVGKTLIASTLALALTEKGYSVGLFDLDLHSPSTHIILGIPGIMPSEDKGLIPPVVHGLSYMSLFFFIGDKPAPLRGGDITNIILELLSITRWGSLDYLIVDTPPGTGEEVLDTTRLIKEAGFLVVATPSRVTLPGVRRLVSLLKDTDAKIIGLLENMSIRDKPSLRDEAERLNIPYIDYIIYDTMLEGAIGDIDRLKSTCFMGCIRRIAGFLTNMI